MFVLLLHRLDNKTRGFARLQSNIKSPFLPDLPLPLYKKILLQLAAGTLTLMLTSFPKGPIRSITCTKLCYAGQIEDAPFCAQFPMHREISFPVGHLDLLNI